MTDTIRSYLNEEITAFQFNDALQEIASATKDRTVQEMVQSLWYYYDDCVDHKIVADKETWDYFHRVLLLLESNGELEITTVRKWSFRQLIAACSLAGFLLVVIVFGWGQYLYIVSIPLGVLSIFLSFWHSWVFCKQDKAEKAIAPFSSFREIVHARRKITAFHKKPYPAKLKKRKIRHSLMAAAMWLLMIVMWLLFAPIPLLFQAIPEKIIKMKVRIPG